jgi:hypothetical protein
VYLIWDVVKVNNGHIFISSILKSFFEIILGGDQPKWDKGRVNSVTFAG